MKISKRILISLLILGLLTGTAAISMAEGDASDDAVAVPSGPAAVTGKDEIVYARLSGDGEARGVYVVNHFTLAKGGSFSDYGHYTAVTNLTDLHPLTLADDTVAIRTENENFYYQGDLADDGLPWRYSIRYSLDGADMEPKDLAGASGRLEIHLTSAPNEAIDDTFYLNYMQQITLTLDTDKCANITADGAAPAMAGKSRALAFTILPGNDANITVTADVRDFEMAGIDITAIPFSMRVELPDISGLEDDFIQLSQAISQLNEGVGKLKDGAAGMKPDAAHSPEDAPDSGEELSQLGANSARLADAAAQIQSALSLLTYASSALNVPEQISEGLSTLSQSYAEFHSGLLAYTEGVEALAAGYTELNAGLASLGEGASQLADKASGLPERLKTELDNIIKAYTGDAFEAISFTSARNESTGFVQFVFKAQGIEKPRDDNGTALAAEQLSFWERLAALFGQ